MGQGQFIDGVKGSISWLPSKGSFVQIVQKKTAARTGAVLRAGRRDKTIHNGLVIERRPETP